MRRIELLLEGNRFTSDNIYGYLYEPENGKINKVIYVIHGITEHMGRYEAFASEMCNENIAVVGIDLRGHGKANTLTQIASFGQNGFECVLRDIDLFYDYVNQKYNKDIYFLGFSLGSFLLREYINEYSKDKIAGAIIMGTGSQPSWILSMIMAVVKGEINKVGYDKTTPLIKNLSFGEYNKKFKPNQTDFDWLCSSIESLHDYMNDPMCKKDISAGLFYDLLASMKKTGLKDAYNNVNKNLPILLLSGTDDPVGDMSKGVKKVYDDMLKAGFKNVKLELFDKARHDILHETHVSSKVYSFIKDFINE